LLKFKGYNISSTFNGQNNDVLVGEFSAYGGLDFSYYNVALNTDHLQETASSEIGQDVVRLVTGPLDNFYQPGFPAPVVSSSALVRTPHWVPSAQSTLPTAPFVSITAPTAGQVFQPGDTLTVTATPNAGTTLTQVLIYAGSSQQAVGSTLLSAGPFTASFTIPNNYLGDLPITVLAQDSNGNICNVTIHAVVQTTATLSSMTVAAGATAPSGAALLTSQGSTTPLTVTGTFSDATQADITASALGTACISSDPAVATVSAEGILTAQADGNCTITVTNGTVTATKNVIVQLGTPTILSVTPASGTAGTTVSLALVGSDLGGASKIEFYLNGTPDPNITATTLQATPQGDGLTAAVTLAPGAVAGLRTVVVITPGGPSDILAAPDAAGFTVIPASSGGSHVLWTNTNGTASLWNYAVAGGTFTQNTYGPYPGWSAKAVADGGTDGKTRVLWTNTDGTISLWSLDSASGSFTHHEFGPYPGWTASAVSVGPDNTTHLLWTNTDGTASLWNYSTDSGTFTQNAYGPYSGWSAKAVADGGTDGKTRLLWTNTDGTMSLWSLDNTAGSFTQNTFGPYPGWTASAVSVAPDNTTHIVWNKTDGTASVWNYSTATGGFTQNSYGPYPGWSAGPVADTAGKTALLWTNTDGTASIWDLDNASGVFSQYSFGPYGGWSAIGLSAAP